MDLIRVKSDHLRHRHKGDFSFLSVPALRNEYNAKEIEASPLWKKLPIFDQKIILGGGGLRG